MSSRPVTVSAELEVHLIVPGAPRLPVHATLHYDVADPYAVRISFRIARDGDAVAWTFARQLLTDGVTRPAGEGDVRTWPGSGEDGQLVCLSLTSPSGSALFELPVPEVVEFLTLTYAAVPTGDESGYVDLEAELAYLLRSIPES